MPRKPKLPPLTLAAPAAPSPPPAQLPLKAARGVRVVLEGADIAAVEAAAAEMKARFGARFAITARRPTAKRDVLRISASLTVRPDDALDAAGG
jgi:hypothetical protein